MLCMQCDGTSIEFAEVDLQSELTKDLMSETMFSSSDSASEKTHIDYIGR